jgi:hypothetical protein
VPYSLFKGGVSLYNRKDILLEEAFLKIKERTFPADLPLRKHHNVKEVA